MKPAIIAGGITLHAWCNPCQAPTRIRIPLHLGSTASPAVNVLEVCPGCGTGHDRPNVEVTPAREAPRGHLIARLARALHARSCRRKGRLALGCAYGDCQWPGLWRLEHAMDGDEGTWRYLFCTKRHRRSWAADHQLRLDREVRL